MKTHHPLVIGNWKMNPPSLIDAVALATAVKKNTKKITAATIVLTPPAVFIPGIAEVLQGSA